MASNLNCLICSTQLPPEDEKIRESSPDNQLLKSALEMIFEYLLIPSKYVQKWSSALECSFSPPPFCSSCIPIVEAIAQIQQKQEISSIELQIQLKVETSGKDLADTSSYVKKHQFPVIPQNYASNNLPKPSIRLSAAGTASEIQSTAQANLNVLSLVVPQIYKDYPQLLSQNQNPDVIRWRIDAHFMQQLCQVKVNPTLETEPRLPAVLGPEGSHSMNNSSIKHQQINIHQSSKVNPERVNSEAKNSLISSTIERDSVPELGSSGINNLFLNSEVSGLKDFSIQENESEFSKSLTSLGTDLPNNEISSSPSKSVVELRENSYAEEPSKKKKKPNPIIIHDKTTVIKGNSRKPKMTYGRSKKSCKSSTAQDDKTSDVDSHSKDPQTSKASTSSSSSFTVSLRPSESFSASEQINLAAGPVSNAVQDTQASYSPSTSGVKVKDIGSEPKEKKKRNIVIIPDHITVIAGKPIMFQCNFCMKKFKTKAHIKYHAFCQNGEKPFKCEQCGQGFIAKSHYEYHLRTHTGERPYVCPKCGKGFNQQGKVTRHIRCHTGEKPHICGECGRGFANAQVLRSHHLIHTGERPYHCEFCQKRFTGMTNLKKHMIIHTGERPFLCNYCGKSFGLNWALKLHLRTHSSERPYTCDQCSKAFSNSKDLRRHLVVHTEERPFKCWICEFSSSRNDNLNRHIKNVHNQPIQVTNLFTNKAAAEYLAQSEQVPVPPVSHVISHDVGTSPLSLQDNEDDKDEIEGQALWEASQLQSVDTFQLRSEQMYPHYSDISE